MSRRFLAVLGIAAALCGLPACETISPGYRHHEYTVIEGETIHHHHHHHINVDSSRPHVTVVRVDPQTRENINRYVRTETQRDGRTHVDHHHFHEHDLAKEPPQPVRHHEPIHAAKHEKKVRKK
ncbi:MAG: hypothetical protein R3F20_03365 [Planctomycetota bacterium]